MKSLIMRLLLLFVIMAALWLLAMRYPGDVVINWLGYEVTSPLSFVLPLVLFLTVIIVEIDRLWLWLAGIPKRFMRKRKEGRNIKGAQLIMEGFNAVAAADSATANKIAARARQMIGRESKEFHSLATLLSAQTAELDGNDDVATGYYRGMLDGPAKFLAMSGLLKIYVKNIPDDDISARDRIGEAIRMAEQAIALQPNAAWLITMLADLYVSYGKYNAATDLLERARRKTILPEDQANKKLATAYTANAIACVRDNKAMAIMAAGKAISALPSHSPAVEVLADIYQKSGDYDLAAKTIEKSWKHAANRNLAERYLHLLFDVSPEKRLKRVEKMVRPNHNITASQVLLAMAANEAGDYVMARQYINQALKNEPDNGWIKQVVAKIK